MHPTFKSSSSRSKLSLKRKKSKKDVISSLQRDTLSSCDMHLTTNAPNLTSQSQPKPKLQPCNDSRFSLVLTKINLSQHAPKSQSIPLETNMVMPLSIEIEATSEGKHTTQNIGCQQLEKDLPNKVAIEGAVKKLEEDDFKDHMPQMIRKRKDLKTDHMQCIEENQLQLALALSASVDQPHPPPPPISDLTEHPPTKRARKRAKLQLKEVTPPPLLTVSSQQSRELLAQRAQDILKDANVEDDDDITCTPAFWGSKLAVNIQSLEPSKPKDCEELCIVDIDEPCSKRSNDDAISREQDKSVDMQGQISSSCTAVEAPRDVSFAIDFQHLDYPTLWELTDCQRDDFYVPSLSSIITPVKATPHTSALTDRLPTPPTDTPTLERGDKEQSSLVGIKSLCSDLKTLIGSSLFNDVEIITREGSVIPSHAVLLAARCQALRNLLSETKSRPIRLNWSGYEEEVVLSFLEFLYTGTISTIQCDQTSLTALAREWSLEELEGLCMAQTTAAMLSDVIYSQFGAINEDSDPMNEKAIINSDSAEVEISNDHIENVTNTYSPIHMSLSPEIIDLSQSSDVESLLCDPPLNTTCTELADQQVLISESSPKCLDNELSTIVPINLSLDQLHDSENILSVVDVPSPTDPNKQSPDSPFRMSLSSSVSTESLELEPHHQSHPNSAHQLYYDSDDLFSASPPTTHSKVTLSSPNEEESDVSIIVTKPNLSLSPVNADQQLQDLDLEPDFYGIDQDTITGGVNVSQVMFSESMMMFDEFPHPSSVVNNEATPIEAVAGNQKTLGKSKVGSAFRTPLEIGRFRLETDEDITPMPDYHTMVTPALKERCAKFGVKPLAKRKMIAKLDEIYDYTHPLVGEYGEIVEQTQEPTENSTKGKKVTKKTTSSKELDSEYSLQMRVKASICSDKQLYQDMLMYKPIELALIHGKLKASGVSVSKERLRDILDQWCVTFTIPRHADVHKKDTVDTF